LSKMEATKAGTDTIKSYRRRRQCQDTEQKDYTTARKVESTARGTLQFETGVYEREGKEPVNDKPDQRVLGISRSRGGPGLTELPSGLDHTRPGNVLGLEHLSWRRGRTHRLRLIGYSKKGHMARTLQHHTGWFKEEIKEPGLESGANRTSRIPISFSLSRGEGRKTTMRGEMGV